MNYPKSPFGRNPLVEPQLFKRNAIIKDEYISWLCKAPAITTYRVNVLKTTVESFMTELKDLLNKMYETPPEVYRISEVPEVICIDPLQETVLESEKTAPKEVIVDVNCGAAILRGAHIYAPGVLAMESGTKLKDLVKVYADLAAKCKKGTNVRYMGEKCFLGIGEVQQLRYQLYNSSANFTQKIGGIAVKMISNIAHVPPLGDLSCNKALLQNLPSIVCVKVLDPKPGELILDMCASPGNKTTHIAELMKDNGLIIALDKTKKKIDEINKKIILYDFKIIKCFEYDSTKAFSAHEFNTVDPKQKDIPPPPYQANTFDRILLDVPCSALGNRPLLTSNMTTKQLNAIPNVQRNLIEAAVQLLKPNGILVYSTCTITEDENESMISWILRNFSQMELEDCSPRLGGYGLSNAGLSEKERKLVQRFGPVNYVAGIDTVGFFIAKLRKKIY